MKNKISFYNGVKNTKKIKFKLIKTGAVLVLCAGILTSCAPAMNFIHYKDSNTNYNYNHTYNHTQNYTNEDFSENQDTNTYAISNVPNEQIAKDYSQISGIILKLDPLNHTDAINTINNTYVDFKYEKNYNINAALNAYNQYKKNLNITSHNQKLKSLDVNELYNIVLNNNKEYLAERNKEHMGSFYKELDNNTIKLYCQYIIEQINYLRSESPDIDYEKVLCILSDLKILKKPDLANAYITDDECLVVTNSMDMLSKMHPGINTYEATIKHEAGHLVQKNCKHELTNELERRVGISYNFKNLDVNSLYYNWFYEASTEKNMCNALNIDNLVYSYFIGYLNSLEFSQVLSTNNNVHQMENLSLQNDLNKLYEAFNANTNEEKMEVLKLMYSLTILENEPEDFFKSINIDLKTVDKDELKAIKRVLKTSILETTTKYFYKNLLNSIKENEMSINDVFFLVTLFENDINSHIDYNLEEEYEYNKDFIDFYYNFQNDIFKYIAYANNIDIEEFYKLFNEYCVYKLNGEETVYNCDLNWLNRDKKDFIFKLYKETKAYSAEHIVDSYMKFTNNKVFSYSN